MRDPEIANDNSKLAQLQDHPKDQGRELIEINLTKEGNEAQPIMLSLASHPS